MGTVQERKVLARLIQESLVQVVKGNAIFGNNFELDGLICLSGESRFFDLLFFYYICTL